MKNNLSVNNYKAKKYFGQNFLQDSSIISQIIQQIKNHTKQDEFIIEIGPGLGALTQELINQFSNLYAIEIDNNLTNSLRHNYPNLKLFNQNVLKFNFKEFYSSTNKQKVHLAGNLPYNISSPLLLYLLENINYIKGQHFMLQKEVVDRIIAKPKTKQYGRLSILLQAHYTIEKTIDVASSCFIPQPKVNSAVILMQPNIKINVAQAKILEYITNIFFSQRRKMLRSFVAHKLILEQYGLNLNQRAEEISVEEYIDLAIWWSNNSASFI